MDNRLTINIGGDFCITTPYISNDLLSEGIIACFNKADYNIINLECPIYNGLRDNKILKTGPHLYTTEAIIDQLKKLKIKYITMANNHVLDYGDKILSETLQLLNFNGINIIGAGNNLKDASRHAIIDKNNVRVGLYNMCENEWSIASEASPGANPLDIVENYRHIKDLKRNVDFIILIIHSGHELYQLPSPRMVKLFRFFADIGADAVISHHSHCFSGYEIYNEVPIIYSTGNLLFTRKSNNRDWYSGIIAQLTLTKDKGVEYKAIPTTFSEDDYQLKIAEGRRYSEISIEIERLNRIIMNNDSLKKEWKKYLSRNREAYIYNLSICNMFENKYLREILKIFKIHRIIYSRRQLKYILNSLQCEAHNDVAREVLKTFLIH